MDRLLGPQTQTFSRVHYIMATLLVVAFGVLAATYSLIIPMWEAPDEVGHFNYITHLLTTASLPEQRVGSLGQAHQPPLYYMVAAVVVRLVDFDKPVGTFRPNPDFIWAGGSQPNVSLHSPDEAFPFRGQVLAFHLVRGVSVLMGMATVGLTVVIGWQIFPDWPMVGLLAAALVAFNPQFLFISGSINNDNLLIVATTGILWQTLRATSHPEQIRQWLWVGFWIAVATLAKLSSFVVAMLAGFVLVAHAVRRRSLKQLAHGGLAMGLPVMALGGWWFVRNQVLYGDPLGWTVFREVFAVVFRANPLELKEIFVFFEVQFRSFWGVFGWMSVLAPKWFYTFVGLMLAASFSGLGVLVVGGGVKGWSSFQKVSLTILVLSVVLQELYMLWAITRFNASWYQGRYLFPVLAPAMIVVSLGHTKWLSFLPRRSRFAMAGGFMVIMAIVAIFMCFWVIAPTYGK